MKTPEWDKRPERLVEPIHSQVIDKENGIVRISIIAKFTDEEFLDFQKKLLLMFY